MATLVCDLHTVGVWWSAGRNDGVTGVRRTRRIASGLRRIDVQAKLLGWQEAPEGWPGD